MKHSKKIYFLFYFLIIAFIACSDSETKEPPFLKIDTNSIGMGTAAGEQTISIKTNIENWSVAVNPDASSWLSVSRQGNNLTIKVAENSDADVRKGEIILSGNGLTETIVVEQLGVKPAIIVNSEIYTLESDGGEINLEILSNIEYEIVIPEDVLWIKPKESAKTRSNMIKTEFDYDVAWNPTEAERQTELIIKEINGTLEKKVLVIQKGQEGYSGASDGDIKDDIKVKVSSGKASSFQPGSNIENSFDGDMETLYHSAWANQGDNYFPITLDYNFENEESIDYLIYYPRQSGPNGNFKETEIWVSTKENPTLTKLKDFDFKGTNSATKVVFDEPLINPKTIQFVVKSGAGDGQGFASCAEMEFYRTNPDNFDPLSLFTDITCTQLKPGVTIEDIKKVSNNLYRNMAFYMLEDSYPREFRIEEYKAWPHPDKFARENKTSQLSLLDNPTGISVSKDEELIVFVGDTHDYNLSIKIQDLDTPGADGYNNASSYPLSEGVNKIITRNKGLVYLFYHTEDYESAPAIKVHFATGKVNGYYDSQKHQPEDWSKYLNGAVDKYFDVVGKDAHLTFPTEAFRAHAANNGDKLIDAYDDMVQLEKKFIGLDKYNRPTINRAYYHVMYTAYMYSTSYRTAYNNTTVSHILNVNTLKASPWGPAHETGHTFQTRPGFLWKGMTEVTVNVPVLYVQTEWGNPSRIQTEDMGRYNNRYEKAYHSAFVMNTLHPEEEDVFCKLVSLWQLQLYFANASGYTDFYKDYYETVRISPDQPTSGKQQLQFVKDVCDVTETNLTRFFKKWGYLKPFDGVINDYGEGRLTVTQKQIDEVIAEIEAKNYPEVTDMIEYISDSNWTIFKDKLPIQKGTASMSGPTIEMKNWQNVVAYEVYNGDELIFVSNIDSFQLNAPASEGTKVFAIAYNGEKIEVSF